MNKLAYALGRGTAKAIVNTGDFAVDVKDGVKDFAVSYAEGFSDEWNAPIVEHIELRPAD